jgi:hypothetical protein
VPDLEVSRDFPVALAATFVITQLADALSALVVSREINPIIGGTSPIVSIVLKVILICFVLAVVQVIRPQRPLLARVVLVIGVIAGIVGTISNTDLTPIRG